MRFLLVCIVLLLLAILYNQCQEEVIPPPVAPDPPPVSSPVLPRIQAEQEVQSQRVLKTRVYWQESAEYMRWRTSIKTSIEDAQNIPTYSGGWITEQYWSWE